MVGCKPYSFYGVDPVAALEELAHRFKECISVQREGGTNRVKINGATETMVPVSSSNGTYYLCGCESRQVQEFRDRHPGKFVITINALEICSEKA